MKNDRIVERVYVGECTGSRSIRRMVLIGVNIGGLCGGMNGAKPGE